MADFVLLSTRDDDDDATRSFSETFQAECGRSLMRVPFERWIHNQTTTHASPSNDGSRARVPIVLGPGPGQGAILAALALGESNLAEMQEYLSSASAAVVACRYSTRVFIPEMDPALVELSDVCLFVHGPSPDALGCAIAWIFSDAGRTALCNVSETTCLYRAA